MISNAHTHSASSSRPNALQIFDETADEPLSTGRLHSGMTLTQFYRIWFLPIVLVSEVNARPGTIAVYETALTWWQKLTGDPPLAQIDEFTLSEFTVGLRQAKYRRGPFAPERQLSAMSVAKQQKSIKAVLMRIGPTIDPRRPGKKLVPEVPYLRVTHATLDGPKPVFSLELAKRIVASAGELSLPMFHSLTAQLFWQRLLGGLFYCGLRFGTVWDLRWEMLQSEDDGYWLVVPCQTKTGKAKRVAMHPLWLAALQPLQPTGRIFPQRPCKTHLDELHRRLQTIAGTVADRQLSFHAWRRTHADQMARLGATAAQRVAQHALDHSDVRTTTGHYCDIDNLFRRSLPPLW